MGTAKPIIEVSDESETTRTLLLDQALTVEDPETYLAESDRKTLGADADTLPPPQRTLSKPRKTDNLTYIRNDLAQLNEDMSSGEQFYAQSLKRINNLINYAYETEANLSALEHLEPENRRLNAELEEVRKKAIEETVRADTLKTKADTYEIRYLDTRQALEKTQLQLSKIEGAKEKLSRELASKDVEISGLTNSNRTIRNELNVDRQSHEKLSTKNLNLTSDLSLVLSEKLELEKRNVEFTARFDMLTTEKNELERILAQTRARHQATADHNIKLKTEIEQILADVKVFRQQFDETSRGQSVESNALKAKVCDLEAELTIKTELVSRAHEEMAELRAKHDSAHRGRRNLLDHIEKQKLEADGLRDSEDSARAEIRNYTSQVISLQAEVDELRRTNSMQSDKLKKYMAIGAMRVSSKPVYPERSAVPDSNLAQIDDPATQKTSSQIESGRYDMVGGISSKHSMSTDNTASTGDAIADKNRSPEEPKIYTASPAEPSPKTTISSESDLQNLHTVDLIS